MRTPKLPISPNGTGDLFAALLVAARVRGADTPDALSHAASAIFAVLERTAASGTEEMRIVESAELLVNPQRKFECYRDQPRSPDESAAQSGITLTPPRISLRSIRATDPQDKK